MMEYLNGLWKKFKSDYKKNKKWKVTNSFSELRKKFKDLEEWLRESLPRSLTPTEYLNCLLKKDESACQKKYILKVKNNLYFFQEIKKFEKKKDNLYFFQEIKKFEKKKKEKRIWNARTPIRNYTPDYNFYYEGSRRVEEKPKIIKIQDFWKNLRDYTTKY